jgi:hypothetical protein
VTQSRFVKSAGSFLSESQRAVTFGVGKGASGVSIEIRWPSGIVDRADNVAVDQRYVLTEGSNIVVDPRPLTRR